MARSHYIIRVGNQRFAQSSSPQVTNHWHYLSPQHLWGFPKGMTTVKVRSQFIADIANPGVKAYIWFLCNSHGGQPGRFVQLALGTCHLGRGPVATGDPPIPDDVMMRLLDGFDNWFNWQPVPMNTALRKRLDKIPAPTPTYIPTLRRVAPEHASFQTFEALIDNIDNNAALQMPAPQMPVLRTPLTQTLSPPTAETIALDLENHRREQTEPTSRGFVYLIHMTGTTYYKIGMSLDPEIRLRTLQTGNPYVLNIVTTRSVSDMRSAESELHRRYDAQRVLNLNAREWFDFGEGRVEEVQDAFDAIDYV
ncbi:MAG: hypothetical protein L6R41_003204 [Letrouitia leprolyta]|nr:MAG: hypothetical protein L6R41_003204 [Letrouitia leprolyta]